MIKIKKRMKVNPKKKRKKKRENNLVEVEKTPI